LAIAERRKKKERKKIKKNIRKLLTKLKKFYFTKKKN